MTSNTQHAIIYRAYWHCMGKITQDQRWSMFVHTRDRGSAVVVHPSLAAARAWFMKIHKASVEIGAGRPEYRIVPVESDDFKAAFKNMTWFVDREIVEVA